MKGVGYMKNKAIADLIRKTIEKNELPYKFSEGPNPVFNLVYKSESGGHSLVMSIYPIKEDRIFLRVVFPFRLAKEMSATAAMFIANYNKDRAFATLRLKQDGLITMEYTYHILTSFETDRTILEKRMKGLSWEALRLYGKIKQLCDGPDALFITDRQMYIDCLTDNLAAFYLGNDDDEDSKDDDEKLPFTEEKKAPRIFPYSNSPVQNKCS